MDIEEVFYSIILGCFVLAIVIGVVIDAALPYWFASCVLFIIIHLVWPVEEDGEDDHEC